MPTGDDAVTRLELVAAHRADDSLAFLTRRSPLRHRRRFSRSSSAEATPDANIVTESTAAATAPRMRATKFPIRNPLAAVLANLPPVTPHTALGVGKRAI